MLSVKKLFTVILICVMTINAVGIAQVTHICKMAASQVSMKTCDDGDCGTSDCCPVSTEDECCSDVVKYYRQQVSTTLHSAIKLQPDPAIVTLLVSYIPEAEKFISPVVPFLFFDTGLSTGKSILFETHRLLI